MVHFKQILFTCFLVSALFSSSLHVKAISDPRRVTTDGHSIIFNIEEPGSADSYMELIRNIRTHLAHSFWNYDFPLLRPQPAPPLTPSTVSWLNVRLVVGTSSITVWLDTSNLYLRGYSRNDDNVSFEFADTHNGNHSLIPDSQSLGFSGSYVGGRGLLRTAGRTRQETPLGLYALQNAVFVLASPHSSQRDVARSLLVIVQMIPEATRIQSIAQLVYDNYLSDPRITQRMEILQNTWRGVSRAVQRMDPSTADNNMRLPNIVNNNLDEIIWTLGRAMEDFGILLYDQKFYGSRPKRETVAETRVLMNLEYVRVNNIDGESPGNLFGNVTVNDGWNHDYPFYNTRSDNPEDKRPGDFAKLTDPLNLRGAISADDSFVINVDLFDRDALSPNDELSRGEVAWDPMVEDVNFANYDLHLQSVMTGSCGEIAVGYAVLSEALSVTVDVVLIDGDGESPADVYGMVRALQVLGGSVGEEPMILFHRSDKEPVKVKPQQSIPLIRKTFAASATAPLTIQVDLFDYDMAPPDDPIGQGSVEFHVMAGQGTENIKGKYGQVQVSVTFE